MARRVLIVVALSAGCIAAPVGEPLMCETQADCREGTTCIDNYCYGDPPRSITLAGVLTPSDGTSVTEIPALEISEDGEISNVRFAPSVRISGSVSYSTFPLAGSVEFRRPSNIPGLADPTITVEVKTERDPSFEVRLLPGETYEIKIVPGDEPLGPGMARASEVAPARFLSYTVPDVDTQVMWSLEPEGGLRAISGYVTDSTGEPVVGARVRSLSDVAARGVEDRPSTVAVTGDDGKFEVYTSREYDMSVDIEVTLVPAPNAILRLVRPNVLIEDVPPPAAFQSGTITLPAHEAIGQFTIPIEGVASSGQPEPVSGANVLVKTILEESPNLVSYEANAATDQEGNAALSLVSGKTYLVYVTTPPELGHGIVIGAELAVGSYGVTQAVQVPRRVSVAGSIVDASQDPVPGLQIEARLSYPFLIMLDDTQRALAENLVWRATESADGYLIHVDAELFGVPTRYDIEVTPPPASWLPSWQFDQIVDFTRDTAIMNSISLDPKTLPVASVVRALVTDPSELPVPSAHLEVFALADTSTICLAYQGNCQPKPRSLALGVADEFGRIDPLILPNPDAP